jgi:aquaporin Z
LFTFALASVVLHVSTSDQIKDNYYYGIAIGLTLLAGVYSVGQLTGGVFNPALGLGTMIVDAKEFTHHGAKFATYLLEYLVGPFAGAAIATGVYRFINGPAKKAHHVEA